MVALEDFLNKSNVAVIEAFYPGMEGANALALSIFGHANKWGRMPYTVYLAFIGSLKKGSKKCFDCNM